MNKPKRKKQIVNAVLQQAGKSKNSRDNRILKYRNNREGRFLDDI
jgi:hypothetical protein